MGKVSFHLFKLCDFFQEDRFFKIRYPIHLINGCQLLLYINRSANDVKNPIDPVDSNV